MPRFASPPPPYVKVPGPPEGQARRLLVVSYHFPPSPAVGGLRWQRLAWLAGEQGWGVDVIAREPAELGSRDESRLRDLAPGLRAFGAPTPGSPLDDFADFIVRRLRTAREHWRPNPVGATGVLPPPTPVRSVPRSDVRWEWREEAGAAAWHAWRTTQAEREWAKVAARLGQCVVRPRLHRAVISCGPPHEVHTAGRWLAEQTGLPLVLDLRDPWSLQQRLGRSVASPLWFRLAGRHEARAVARAALVVCNTEPAADAMRQLYPRARVISVMNGMDDGELPASTATDRFVIGYAGAIYMDRDPRPLFRAARRVAQDLGLGPDRFGIEFIGEAGRFEGQSLDEIAREEDVTAFLRIGRRRPYAEAMAFLASCAMLVSLPQDSTLAIPSKVFEYLRCPAWLLALAEAGSATARVLEGTEADVVSPDDVEGIAAAIRRRYERFAAGERPRPLGTDRRLTRRHQGGLLLDALEKVTSE